MIINRIYSSTIATWFQTQIVFYIKEAEVLYEVIIKEVTGLATKQSLQT